MGRRKCKCGFVIVIPLPSTSNPVATREMASDLRDKGIEIAWKAVHADEAGNFDKAISKYIKATEYLMKAAKYEKNPVTLRTLREKCNEYTSRAETLKDGLLSGGGSAA